MHAFRAAAEGAVAEGKEQQSHGPIFVSFREIKGPAISRAGKKPTHLKRFYLVDSHGNETLAATGEDQGDAHYIYRNADTFTQYGELDCHNRKELVAWLDRIKQQSQDAAGFHLIEDPPDQTISVSPVGSPMRSAHHPPFVAYRQEKFAYEDGHRGQKWFLVDESGHEQLAVTAEERETRDGHYTYKAEGPLAQLRPLMASNMGMVQEWLEQMLQHPLDPHLESQPGAGGPKSDRGHAFSMGHRKAKGTPAEHGASSSRLANKRGPVDTISSDETKRQKLLANEGTEAGDRELLAFELRRLAAREGAKRRSAANSALDWVKAPLDAEQVEHLEFWIAAAKSGAAGLEASPTSGDHSRAAALCDVLEALREIAETYTSLPLLAQTGLVPELLALEQHEESSVSSLATRALQQIRGRAASHIAALASRRLQADPAAGVEGALRAAATKFGGNKAPPGQSPLLRGLTAHLQQAALAAGRPSPLQGRPVLPGTSTGTPQLAGALGPSPLQPQTGAAATPAPAEERAPGITTTASTSALPGLSQSAADGNAQATPFP